MDKETRKELDKLDGRLEDIEEDHRKWNSLVTTVLARLLVFFVGIITSGLGFAFYVIHSSAALRRIITDWWVGK